jgi:hypothetical protein
MDRYTGPKTTLNIDLPGRLYIQIIMDCYGVPQTSLSIALHVGL